MSNLPHSVRFRAALPVQWKKKQVVLRNIYRLKVSVGFLRPEKAKKNALAQAKTVLYFHSNSSIFQKSVASLFKEFQQLGAFCCHH